MSRYVINSLATQDLKDIADYFTENSIGAGERFFQGFDKKCKQLVAFPNSGKSYDEIRAGLRGISFQGYIVFYMSLDNSGIEILRVVNGRRDLLQLFDN